MNILYMVTFLSMFTWTQTDAKQTTKTSIKKSSKKEILSISDLFDNVKAIVEKDTDKDATAARRFFKTHYETLFKNNTDIQDVINYLDTFSKQESTKKTTIDHKQRLNNALSGIRGYLTNLSSRKK